MYLIEAAHLCKMCVKSESLQEKAGHKKDLFICLNDIIHFSRWKLEDGEIPLSEMNFIETFITYLNLTCYYCKGNGAVRKKLGKYVKQKKKEIDIMITKGKEVEDVEKLNKNNINRKVVYIHARIKK